MNDTDLIRQSYPILEFDSSRQAIIEPSFSIEEVEFPQFAVGCFFQDAIDELIARHAATVLTSQRSEMGSHPIYQVSFDDTQIAVFHACEGAPLAGALIEEVIALGAKTIIACGSAGTLVNDIQADQIILPTAAIRDEGTSYHYLPPSREVTPSLRLVAGIRSMLHAQGIDYMEGKTWTTDAVYRETYRKVKQRREEGCIIVEMEAAAFFAIAQFRGIDMAEILYAGDSLGSGCWQQRGWRDRTEIRRKLLRLSIQALHDFARGDATDD